MARYRFECLPGYQLIGHPVVDCSIDGYWTQTPSCQIDKSLIMAALINGGYIGTNCPEKPPFVSNGRFRRLKNHPTSLLFYYCRPGYELAGPPAVFCERKTSRWTLPPKCLKRNRTELSVAILGLNKIACY